MTLATAARHLFLALSFLAAVLAGHALTAQAASRVVLLRAGAGDPLSRQATTLLKAELQALGFEVAEEVGSESAEAGSGKGESGRGLRRQIEGASVRQQAVATFAIRTIPGGTAVELWLEDRLTGKLVIRRVDVAAGEGAAADLAVKAVELLRGSLLEVRVQEGTRNGAGTPTPPEVRRFVADAERARHRGDYFAEGMGITAGAAVLSGVGLTAPALAPMLRLSWGDSSGHLLRVSAIGLGSSPRFTAVEGTARVYQTVVAAEVLRVFRAGAPVQPFLGGGAGLYRVRSAGQGVSALFPDGDETGHAAAAVATVGLAGRLANRLALVADFHLVLSLPRAAIEVAGREVARAGGATGLLTASICGIF